MSKTGRSTDNESGRRESTIVLRSTTRNRETAAQVDALLAEAESLGVSGHLLTRRQARKALLGRGTLRRELALLNAARDRIGKGGAR